MITITGIVELMDSNSQEAVVDIRHKCNIYWDEALNEAKSVFEFDFEYDPKEDCYDFVGVRKISKAKARKNIL